VSINQGIGAVAATGSRTVNPAVTTTYTLTATNASGTTTATATLTVVPAPTASLGATPTTINQGQTATLSWSTTNATTVSINQGIGAVGPTGTLTVSPATTTTYQLTATNSAGTATATATVTVVIPPPPLPTVTASVTPTSITAGGSATLSWSSTNAATVTIDQGVGTVATSGTTAVSPATTTTYTATATNVTGSATATATLTVNPAAAGSSLQFDGSSQHARFTALPAMTVFTVEGWVKRTAGMGRYETFFSNADSFYGRETFGLYVDGANTDCGSSPPNQFALAYTQVGGGFFFQCSGVTASLNAWHHVAVTRDSSNTTQIFIDGVLRGTVPGTAAPLASTGAFGIGDAGDALAEYFNGLLDEVRISNVVRYTSTFTPQTTAFATDANTVALYHLDEGTGQTLADASGNGRNGVLGTTSAVEPVDPTWSTDSPVH
jgi:PKD repeat protein